MQTSLFLTELSQGTGRSMVMGTAISWQVLYGNGLRTGQASWSNSVQNELKRERQEQGQ